MDQELELKKLEQDVTKLDATTTKTDQDLLKLTRWIIVLTGVMVLIGVIQIFSTWPKRTYCIDVTEKVQLCEPDYYPFDSNPSDAAYKLDKKFGFD